MKISADTLSARITRAFGGIRLGGGISLIETEFADGGQFTPPHLIDLEEKMDWTKIINDRLCNFPVTFSFTDFKGFRFYIAPYMILTLRNYETSDSIISDYTIYAIDPGHHVFDQHPFLDVFTFEQVVCMRDFLLFSIENDYHLDGDAARSNLNKLLHVAPALKQEAEQGGDGDAEEAV
jgi:hypothetical protein